MADELHIMREATIASWEVFSGAVGARYRPESVRDHAIWVRDGVRDTLTVCGVVVPGAPLDATFEAGELLTRCARCADLFGLPRLPH